MAKKKKTSKKSSGKKSSLKDQMKSLKKRWSSATPTQGGATAPPGDHECRIETCVLEQAKSSGRYQINYGLIIIEGDLENRKFHKYAGLDDQGLDYSLGDLEALELEVPDDPDDLGEVCEEAAGLEVLVNVSADEFHNITFIELLEAGEGEEGEEGEETEAGEEDEGEDFSKGDRVTTEIDGEDYAGEITKIKGDKATVKFDDGDSDTFDLSDLESEEGEEGEEEPGEEAEEPEEGEEELDVEAVEAMDEDELKKVVKDYELGVKLKKFKTLKKKRKAVIDELFEE